MIPFPRLLWDRPGLILGSPAPRSPWVKRRRWEVLFPLPAPCLPAIVCQHRTPLGVRQPEALGLTVEPAGSPLLVMKESPALSGPLEVDRLDGEKQPSCGKRPCRSAGAHRQQCSLVAAEHVGRVCSLGFSAHECWGNVGPG